MQAAPILEDDHNAIEHDFSGAPPGSPEPDRETRPVERPGAIAFYGVGRLADASEPEIRSLVTRESGSKLRAFQRKATGLPPCPALSSAFAHVLRSSQSNRRNGTSTHLDSNSHWRHAINRPRYSTSHYPLEPWFQGTLKHGFIVSLPPWLPGSSRTLKPIHIECVDTSTPWFQVSLETKAHGCRGKSVAGFLDDLAPCRPENKAARNFGFRDALITRNQVTKVAFIHGALKTWLQETREP